MHAGMRSALPGAARPPGVGDASRSDWLPRRGAGHAHAVAAVLLRQKESAERPVRVDLRGPGRALAGGRVLGGDWCRGRFSTRSGGAACSGAERGSGAGRGCAA